MFCVLFLNLNSWKKKLFEFMKPIMIVIPTKVTMVHYLLVPYNQY